MRGKKVIYATVAFFIIAIIFYAGTMAMNQLCTIDQASQHNPHWAENSGLVCQLFTNLAQLIKQITNSI
ncbi:MAG: hypothetical protein ACYDAJ_08310 [Nitrosotalea sp.]